MIAPTLTFTAILLGCALLAEGRVWLERKLRRRGFLEAEGQ